MLDLDDKDIAAIQLQFEQQVRLSALGAQQKAIALQAGQNRLGLGTLPDFPPDPNIFKTIEILGKYAIEAVKHAPDCAIIVNGIIRLMTTPDGRILLERLQAAIFEKKYDPTLFKDFLQTVGGGAAGYGTLQIGVVTEVHLGGGIVGITGVALPTKGDGKVKWFSGMEKSAGLIVEGSVNLAIGQRIKEPAQLTGQFYGGHTGIEVGISLGSSLYFDTSEKLEYEGYATTIGVGIGGGVSVLSGFELVIPD